MSYSYLQAVFPRFENSKIYDDKIYSSLDSVSTPQPQVPKPIEQTPTNVKEIEYSHLESFTENPSLQITVDSHQTSFSHVMECKECKELLRKQFNLENEKIFKEEIIELVSFIAFGVFLLMLLERKK